MRTVQGDLEAALATVVGGPVDTVGAGRTDAGVHALGQVVSAADVPDGVGLDRLAARLTSLCAPSITVWSALEVGDSFSARFSARSRLYVYALSTAPAIDPFLARTALHHPGPLDVDLMNEAAGHLLGRHDFSSFGRPSSPDSPPERDLYELRCTRSGDIVRIRARANAFLQQMVRSLVGTLLYVGERRRDPSTMPEVLAARDRARAGPVAPPQGLCLVAVEYDDGWSHPPGAGGPV